MNDRCGNSDYFQYPAVDVAALCCIQPVKE